MSRRNRRRPHGKQYWIGYCRKSTDTEDKQIHSLGDQVRMIEDYYARLPAEERGAAPLHILQEAQSAYRPGRPVFDAVLRQADERAVRGLIVVHPNRVSRNHADSGAFVQRLVEGTIPCLDTVGGKRYTGADSNDIFMLTLEGAMSWKDSRDKGDRVLQAMRLRAAEGKHMGQVGIGYRGVYQQDGTRRLEPVPGVAPLIRRLFELAETGSYSLQDLVREGQRMGLRSRNGKKVARSALHNILRDPLYKGYIRFDGIVAKGLHEPIVQEATWERVQVALRSRRAGTGRPKDPDLRELFAFGDLLRCPRCGRTLSPYRVKQRYIYYECKNPETACRVLVPQAALLEQLPAILRGVLLTEADLRELPSQLLGVHARSSKDATTQRTSLHREYEQVQKEIGDQFLRRGEAAALGILDVVDLRLTELRNRRDELQAQLNALHEQGSDWIERVTRCFRLIELLQEAIFQGSARTRVTALRALASNYTVEGKKLVPELRTPFRQRAENPGVLEWLPALYDVRTELADTCRRLEEAIAFWRSAPPRVSTFSLKIDAA
jgi:DNA invertase Pin-like site-specific DNA recombinase